MLNTLIVFTVCGIWHGANWTFIIWGFAYGVLLILERGLRNIHIFDKIQNKTGKLIIQGLNILKTFVIVTLLWCVFRATSFGNLHDVLSAWVHNGAHASQLHVSPTAWIALAAFVCLDLILKQQRFDRWCSQRNIYVRWSIYAVMIFSIIVLSSVQHYPFIYFQF